MTECPVHHTQMVEVCDEFRCGLCYEDSLVTERHVPPPKGDYDYSKPLFKHDFTGFGPSLTSMDRMHDAVLRLENK